MTKEEFDAYIAELRDWKQNLNLLADVLVQFWDQSGGGPTIVGSDGIHVDNGGGEIAISLIKDPAADNGLTVSATGVKAPKAPVVPTVGNGLRDTSGVWSVLPDPKADNGLTVTAAGAFSIKPVV